MFTPVNQCRCCGHESLVPYLDLGCQPLANAYHQGERELPRIPLVVNWCPRCYHSQLSVTVDPEVMFRNYLYVSGTTHTFREHCRRLAVDAMRRTMKPYARVLDIACNDGTLLEVFRDLGAHVVGVDPALNLRPLTERKGIPVVVDFWGPTAVQQTGRAFDVITAQNVFAHCHDPQAFLEACHAALADDGLLVIEFPYGAQTFQQNQFDQIYHEHLSYFLAHSFATLARRCRFQIKDLVETPIHGGSIRFYLSKRHGADSGSPHWKLGPYLERELQLGLSHEATYHRFARNIQKNKLDLERQVREEQARGQKVVGYGASAKGNTLLNFADIALDYIVDDNALKWGYLTPGRDIPIRPVATLASEAAPLSILLLAWNFREEIVKKLHTQRLGQGGKDRVLLYVPGVQAQEVVADA